MLIIGLHAVNFPFFGGTLVPAPDLALSTTIDGSGDRDVSLRWPAMIAPDTGIWFQHWYVDAAAPLGLAASNGLRGISP